MMNTDKNIPPPHQRKYLGGIRLGANNHQITVPAVGDEGLAAVQNILVAIQHGSSAHAR